MNVYIPFVPICIGIVGLLGAMFTCAGFIALRDSNEYEPHIAVAMTLGGIVLLVIAIGAGLS